MVYISGAAAAVLAGALGASARRGGRDGERGEEGGDLLAEGEADRDVVVILAEAKGDASRRGRNSA